MQISAQNEPVILGRNIYHGPMIEVS